MGAKSIAHNCTHAYLLILQDLVRRGGDGRYLGLSSIGPQSSFSGDSSYSFEVGGINLEELDVEFEVILEDLIASTDDTPGPDDRLLRYFCDSQLHLKRINSFLETSFHFLILEYVFSAAALRKSSLRSYSDAVMRRCLSDSFADLPLHLDHLEPAGCGGDLARQRLRSASEIEIATSRHTKHA